MIAADGSVTLPPEAWDGVRGAGRPPRPRSPAGCSATWSRRSAGRRDGQHRRRPETVARLRLADFVADPSAALAAWLPRLALSDRAREALSLLADLFATTSAGGGASPRLRRGHRPPGRPVPLRARRRACRTGGVVPAGRAGACASSPRRRRCAGGGPAIDGLGRLRSPPRCGRGGGGADVRELVDGRDARRRPRALAQRWLGGDGRIVPPAMRAGRHRRAHARRRRGAARLHARHRTRARPRADDHRVRRARRATRGRCRRLPRVVDLTRRASTPQMFAAPAAPAAGDWFVRSARAPTAARRSSATRRHARAGRAPRARARRAGRGVGNDIALVAFAGAGHAARLAAERRPQVTDLLLLGTPLGRHLADRAHDPAHRRRAAPAAPPAAAAPTPTSPTTTDLALGRALVGAMMELAPLADPAADLRPPVAPAPRGARRAHGARRCSARSTRRRSRAR